MIISTKTVYAQMGSNNGAVVSTPSNSGSSKNSSANSGSGSSKSSSSPSKSSSKSSGQTVKSQTLTPKQIAVNSASKIKPVMQQSIDNYVQALQKGYYDVNGSLWLKKYYAPGYESVKVTGIR